MEGVAAQGESLVEEWFENWEDHNELVTWDLSSDYIEQDNTFYGHYLLSTLYLPSLSPGLLPISTVYQARGCTVSPIYTLSDALIGSVDMHTVSVFG